MSAVVVHKTPSDQTKWNISFQAGLLFFLLNLPMTYQLTNTLFSRLNILEKGAPTLTGVALHSLVYVLLTRLMMN